MDNENDQIEEKETNSQQEKIEELLNKFMIQRDELTKMVTDLETLKTRIDLLFPDKFTDARFVRFFEEKVKAATELFKAILDIRKEVMKSLKDEIEIRKKITDKNIDPDKLLDGLIDVRDLARKVEKFKEKVIENIEEGRKEK